MSSFMQYMKEARIASESREPVQGFIPRGPKRSAGEYHDFMLAELVHAAGLPGVDSVIFFADGGAERAVIEEILRRENMCWTTKFYARDPKHPRPHGAFSTCFEIHVVIPGVFA